MEQENVTQLTDTFEDILLSPISTINDCDGGVEDGKNKGQSLSDRIGTLLNSPLYSDVIFTCVNNNDDDEQSQNIEYYAHKIILSVGSTVFNAMLNGDLKESGKIIITDVSAIAFLEILRYLYTDDVHLNEINAYDVLYGAHKYDLQQLEKICSDYLFKILNDDNVCEIYEHIYLFDFEITQKCIDIIQERTPKVLTSEKFYNILPDALHSILGMDNLQIREHLLFELVLKWTERSCVKSNLEITSKNQRNVLGDCMALIRFPIMNADEFAKFIQRLPDFFTSQEIADIFKYILTKDNRNLIFSVEKRQPRGVRLKTVFRLSGIGRSELTFDAPQIDFQVNKKIELLSIGIYGCAIKNTEEIVELHIISHRRCKEKFVKIEKSLMYDGSEQIYHIYSDNPYTILPNNWYRIIVLYKNSKLFDYYHGKMSLAEARPIDNEDNDILFTFKRATLLFVNVRGDRIAEISYKRC